jgi:predicted dehydrogenase
MSTNPILRVGIIGCGQITQVAHIATLGFLSDYFTITFLCDVSPAALAHSAQKVINHVPKTTQNPGQLCASPDVDLVFIASSDEYHAIHVIEALKHDKHVFVEKPMALCERDADAIIAAEVNSKGKVMVGYMRRYAPAFAELVKEVGGMDKILYARVRGTFVYGPMLV